MVRIHPGLPFIPPVPPEERCHFSNLQVQIAQVTRHFF